MITTIDDDNLCRHDHERFFNQHRNSIYLIIVNAIFYFLFFWRIIFCKNVFFTRVMLKSTNQRKSARAKNSCRREGKATFLISEKFKNVLSGFVLPSWTELSCWLNVIFSPGPRLGGLATAGRLAGYCCCCSVLPSSPVFSVHITQQTRGCAAHYETFLVPYSYGTLEAYQSGQSVRPYVSMSVPPFQHSLC